MEEVINGRYDADKNGGEASGTEFVNTNNDYSSAIAVISLLNQFKNVQVREDCMRGKVNDYYDGDVLPIIDELRCIMFPRFNQGKLCEISPRLQQGGLIHGGSIGVKG